MSIYKVTTAGHSLSEDDLLFGGEYFQSHGGGRQYRFKAYTATGEDLGYRNLPAEWLFANVTLSIDEPARNGQAETDFLRQLARGAARPAAGGAREGRADPTASQRVVITPSQALLVMMDTVSEGSLSRAYFNGLTREAFEEYLKRYGHRLAEMNLEVSDDPELINNDETKRYFETHLCFATLREHLDGLELDKLRTLYARALEVAPDGYQVTEGEFHELGVLGIHNTAGAQLSAESQLKYKLLCLMAAVAVAIAKANVVRLPLDIYDDAPEYKEAYRGRMPWPEHRAKPGRSDRLGILRGDMPLPKRDIARSATLSTYKRPADNSTLRPDAEFPQLLHSRLVLPFSNSPSGTMLCQIRLLLHLGYFDAGVKERTWHTYFRCFTAALLYGSGGHSIHEFLVPFQIPEVQLRTKLLNISAVSLFYQGNEKAMARALSFVRTYNRKIIRLKRVTGFAVARMLPGVRSKLAEARRQKEEERARALALAELDRAQQRFTFSVGRAIAANGGATRLKLTRLKEVLQEREWLAGLEARVYAGNNAILAATHIFDADEPRKEALLTALDLKAPGLRDLLAKCLAKQ